MTFHFLVLYGVTVFVATIIPGPSMLLALTHGMQFGIRRTVASALGNVTVTFFQALVSLTGLGALLVASETFFYAVKYVGAAYLIYLGIKLLFSSRQLVVAQDSVKTAPEVSMKKMYLQGVWVTAGNPKAIVFFTAVFPQFITAESAYLTQFSLLMGMLLIAFSCYMLYAIFGRQIVTFFSTPKMSNIIQRCIGGSFIGLGLGLAFSRR